MAVLDAIVAAASAIWVARDARQHGDKETYAIGVLIWWALVFPLYVAHRKGLTRGAQVFLVALVYSGASILATRALR